MREKQMMSRETARGSSQQGVCIWQADVTMWEVRNCPHRVAPGHDRLCLEGLIDQIDALDCMGIASAPLAREVGSTIR